MKYFYYLFGIICPTGQEQPDSVIIEIVEMNPFFRRISV